MLGRALERINKNGFKSWTGARKVSSKVVIIITDGESKDEYQSKAASMRDKGWTIIPVGVGSRASQHDLIELGGDTSNAFYIEKEFGSVIEHVTC